MKRETFILIVALITMVFGSAILLGNKGYIPDYSFWLYPFFIGGIIVILLTHLVCETYYRIRKIEK